MESVIPLVIGGLIVLLGGYMAVTGDARPLHGYHYATTPPDELPRLARETGACLAVTGVGCMLAAPTPLPNEAEVVGVVLLAAGIVGAIVSIVLHNGGLVTFAPGVGLAGLGPRASAAVCVAMGVLLSLVGFVPGVHMLLTHDVSALHSYHYANVAEADIPAFATGEGLSMLGLGLSILVFMVSLAGMVAQRPAPRWSKVLSVASVVLFAASLVALLLVIVCFNGSLAAE